VSYGPCGGPRSTSRTGSSTSEALVLGEEGVTKGKRVRSVPLSVRSSSALTGECPANAHARGTD
jgi:hypothetical protein